MYLVIKALLLSRQCKPQTLSRGTMAKNTLLSNWISRPTRIPFILGLNGLLTQRADLNDLTKSTLNLRKSERHQEDFMTPGIKPLLAASRNAILDIPNLRR